MQFCKFKKKKKELTSSISLQSCSHAVLNSTAALAEDFPNVICRHLHFGKDTLRAPELSHVFSSHIFRCILEDCSLEF